MQRRSAGAGSAAPPGEMARWRGRRREWAGGGAGQRGRGIAHVAALAGLDVVLNDVSADRLKSAMATVNGNLSRQVSKKMITDDARKQALARIVTTETMDGLSDCDLVI